VEAVQKEDLLESAAQFHDPPAGMLGCSCGPRDQEAVALEYTALFSAPGEDYLPPYHSVYTDTVEITFDGAFDCGAGVAPVRARGLLGGPTSVRLRKFYRSIGLELPSTINQPDHVSAELLAMSVLCEQYPQSVQKEFLNEVLSAWVSDWARRVSRSPRADFYKAAASSLLSFLAGEDEYFCRGEEISPPR
jgi:TorA maturation chaperone TorD